MRTAIDRSLLSPLGAGTSPRKRNAGSSGMATPSTLTVAPFDRNACDVHDAAGGLTLDGELHFGGRGGVVECDAEGGDGRECRRVASGLEPEPVLPFAEPAGRDGSGTAWSLKDMRRPLGRRDVQHARAIGRRVRPAHRDLRKDVLVSSESTKNTYSTLNVTVGTVRKSIAMVPARCIRRNVPHVVDGGRRGAPGRFGMYLA